ATLLAGAAVARAQDRPGPGNFDPAEMRQRQMDRLREQFDVKEDSEWKLISERINKVMEARRAVGTGGPGFGFGGPGFGGPGGPGGQGGFRGGPGGPGGPGGRPQGDDNAGGPKGPGGKGGPGGRPPGDDNQDGPRRFGGPGGPGGFGGPGGGGPGGPGGFNRQPDPEADALRNAIESGASAEEIKAKLARLRESRREKEAQLEKAQNDLRQLLSAKQEAVAVMMGLLK
ncbi:MAG: hypothetical protein HY300_20100, partial [Verrucomicrobia bacterium]|nr:hypothetical protein [Verrucomicrobiota bacterium]